jgi:hypothetical protein
LKEGARGREERVNLFRCTAHIYGIITMKSPVLLMYDKSKINK